MFGVFSWDCYLHYLVVINYIARSNLSFDVALIGLITDLRWKHSFYSCTSFVDISLKFAIYCSSG